MHEPKLRDRAVSFIRATIFISKTDDGYSTAHLLETVQSGVIFFGLMMMMVVMMMMMMMIIIMIMIIFEDKDCDSEDDHEANRDGADNNCMMKNIEMMKIVGIRTMMRMICTYNKLQSKQQHRTPYSKTKKQKRKTLTTNVHKIETVHKQHLSQKHKIRTNTRINKTAIETPTATATATTTTRQNN